MGAGSALAGAVGMGVTAGATGGGIAAGSVTGGVAGGFAQTALAAPFGYVQMNFCNTFASTYGYQLSVHRGAQAAVTDEKSYNSPRAIAETAAAGIISVLLTAGSAQGASNQFDPPQSDSAWVYLLGIAGGMLEVLQMVQVIAAYVEGVQNAAAAADAALVVLDPDGALAAADVLTALFTPGAVYNNVKSTAGTVCEYATDKFIGAHGCADALLRRGEPGLQRLEHEE